MAAPQRTILVTGANRGLGRFVASALAQDSSTRIVATARTKEGARALAAELGTIAVALDVGSAESRAALPAALRDCGVARLDSVVNNAGVCVRGWSQAAFDANVGVNFVGTLGVWCAPCSPLRLSLTSRAARHSSRSSRRAPSSSTSRPPSASWRCWATPRTRIRSRLPSRSRRCARFDSSRRARSRFPVLPRPLTAHDLSGPPNTLNAAAYNVSKGERERRRDDRRDD